MRLRWHGPATDSEHAPVRWRWAAWAAGAALLVVAAAVFVAQVQVHSGTSALSCGSAWDATAGRSGWSQWWSVDLADPTQTGRPPARTLRCPTAVNHRIVAAGALAIGALACISAGAVADRRHRRSASGGPHDVPRRLRLFGTALTALGSVLTAAALLGLALLVADPRSTLFLYVSRTVVVLAGLLLVLPAILLIALGRAAVLAADHLASVEDDRAEP